jgi:2-amino-4-hydroxy-6-hydroxymethyldihydropteridine diphosphokinase
MSLGSNIDPEKNVGFALQEIAARYGDPELSPVYETESVGFRGAPFLNLVVGIHTTESLYSVQESLHSIEAGAGRIHGAKSFDNRILDIDIILYGGGVYNGQGINIPRDEIRKYAYVLKPLSDLYPGAVHPVTGLTFSSMWAGFNQPGQSLTQLGDLFQP